MKPFANRKPRELKSLVRTKSRELKSLANFEYYYFRGRSKRSKYLHSNKITSTSEESKSQEESSSSAQIKSRKLKSLATIKFTREKLIAFLTSATIVSTGAASISEKIYSRGRLKLPRKILKKRLSEED